MSKAVKAVYIHKCKVKEYLKFVVSFADTIYCRKLLSGTALQTNTWAMPPPSTPVEAQTAEW